MAKNWVLRLSDSRIDGNMSNGERQNHQRVVAILFVVYGLFHLAVIGFVWIVVLALAREGYFDVFRGLKTLTLVGLTLSMVVMPLLSGYALFRITSWAKGAVWLTCLAILIASLIVLRQLTWPMLSTPRIIVGTLYGGASVTICIYGFWLMSKQRRSLS
jgi:hypothetical protein